MAAVTALRFGAVPRTPRWARGPKRSPLFAAAEARLAQIAAGAAPLWLANLTDALPIFRPGQDGPAERSRQVRRDHAQNVACLLLALITAADWSGDKKQRDRGGFVARPVPSGDLKKPRWLRNGWEKLAQFAFPGLGDAVSLRRVERIVRELTAAGWLRQVRENVEVAPRVWRGRAALKWLAIPAIKALGLYSALRAHWHWREKQSAKDRAAEIESLAGALGVQTERQASSTSVAPLVPVRLTPTAQAPPPTAPPMPTGVPTTAATAAAAAIAQLKALFRS